MRCMGILSSLVFIGIGVAWLVAQPVGPCGSLSGGWFLIGIGVLAPFGAGNRSKTEIMGMMTLIILTLLLIARYLPTMLDWLMPRC